ncbi:MAG: VTT domain-containing protein [Coxiellaceae bacterium]|nr:VTT domain-containing protein [Coxiellaceae bacterium]
MFGININEIVMTIGFVGVIFIIFAETGLFLGFFLPGDSLLFAAGLLASQNYFDVHWLVVCVMLAAFIGYMIGYWFGAKLGGWLVNRPDRWYFKKHYLDDAHAFYQKHGGKALVLARLVPIIRTFVPIVAGMGKMNLLRYTIYNIIGAVVWGAGVTYAGYFLGASIPNAEKYILPITLGIIVLSVLPGIYHIVQKRLAARR